MKASGGIATLHDYFPAMHGTLADGTACTAINVTCASIGPGEFKTVDTGFIADYFLLGDHVLSADQEIVDDLCVRMTHLESWIGPPTYARQSSANDRHTIEVPFHRTEFEAEVPEIDGAINVHTLWQTFHRRRRLGVKHETVLRIAAHTPRSLRWFISTLQSLQKVLALFVFEAVHPITIEVATKAAHRSNLLLMLSTHRPDPSLMPHEVFVPLGDIAGVLGKVLSTWFARVDKIQAVAGLLTGTLYNESLFVEFHFLALMQALESFHRRVKGGQFVDKKTFRSVCRQMNKAIPADTCKDLRKRLKESLNFANEYPLNQRLELLAAELTEDARSMLMPDAKCILAKLKNTRNYLTHYTRPQSAFGADEIVYTLPRLRIFLAFLILREIGIPEDVLVRRLKQVWRLRQQLPGDWQNYEPPTQENTSMADGDSLASS